MSIKILNQFADAADKRAQKLIAKKTAQAEGNPKMPEEDEVSTPKNAKTKPAMKMKK